MKNPINLTLGVVVAGIIFSCQRPASPAVATQNVPKEMAIAFYNLENLFDTENDPNKDDDEFLPTSELQWTNERYTKKLINI